MKVILGHNLLPKEIFPKSNWGKDEKRKGGIGENKKYKKYIGKLEKTKGRGKKIAGLTMLINFTL